MSNTNPNIIETALIKHLSSEVAELQAVGSFGKYEALVDSNDSPPLPSVFVLPDESIVTDTADGFQVENQLWIVSIIVDHSPDVADTDTTATKAGDIMAGVMSALIGWRPTLDGSRLEGFKPMRFEGKGTPIYATGFGEFPVLFSTGLVLTGAN